MAKGQVVQCGLSGQRGVQRPTRKGPVGTCRASDRRDSSHSKMNFLSTWCYRSSFACEWTAGDEEGQFYDFQVDVFGPDGRQTPAIGRFESLRDSSPKLKLTLNGFTPCYWSR